MYILTSSLFIAL